MPQEMPKGLKLMLGMFGITPEMLANPGELLKQFGINSADIIKTVAEFQQIGLDVNTRLARIEKHLGIVADDNAGNRDRLNGAAGGELGNLGQRPPDRRN